MIILLAFLIIVFIAIWISILFKSRTSDTVNRVGLSFLLGAMTTSLGVLLAYEIHLNRSEGKFRVDCDDYYVDTTTVITPYNTTQTHRIYYYKIDK